MRGGEIGPGERLLRGSVVVRPSGRPYREALLRRPAAPRGCRRRRGRGFTLIEMMVALFLIGVGLMGLAALSTTVTRANGQSASLTTASSLAQERIERFRTESYPAIAAGNDVRTVDGVSYARSWAVSPDDPAIGLKTIAVTVAWTVRGKPHSTTLRTIRGSR